MNRSLFSNSLTSNCRSAQPIHSVSWSLSSQQHFAASTLCLPSVILLSNPGPRRWNGTDCLLTISPVTHIFLVWSFLLLFPSAFVSFIVLLSPPLENFYTQIFLRANMPPHSMSACSSFPVPIVSLLSVSSSGSIHGIFFFVDLCSQFSRACGFFFCADCSTGRRAIPRFGLTTPSRVCDLCFVALCSTTWIPILFISDVSSWKSRWSHPHEIACQSIANIRNSSKYVS